VTPIRVRTVDCGTGDDCPAIDRMSNGDFAITGYRPGEARIPANELTIEVPGTLLPELADRRLASITDWILQHQTRDLIRIETLDRYDVASDDDDFHRYVRGDDAPRSAAREPWYERLRAEAAAGRRRRRVWVGRTPLGPYPRYEMEWCFTHNVRAGEDIRVLDVAAVPTGAPLIRTGDFYVADGEHIACHRYDVQGRVAGSVAVDPGSAAPYVALAEMAWTMATPFLDWWAAHPQFHRTGRVA
jgi:hypothetical protein